MKRIIVTGGKGFIGRHLCDRLVLDGLVLDGCEVITIDEKYGYHVQDVAARWNQFVGCCEIYHLACPASPKQYMTDPIHTIDTAFNGTKAVLELAKETGAKVLIASSSEIYGCPTKEDHPQVETYAGRVWPYTLRSCYDEGKRAAEALAYAYEATHHVTVQIARIFNTYGPGMGAGDGRVVSTFIDQALRGAPLTVHGDGQQTRSLCYIDDLVEGLIQLMGAKTSLGPVNLGNPEEITVEALAREIITLTGSSSPIHFDDALAFDPARRCPGIARAKTLLGWVPKITREEGFKRTIEWWRRTQ